MSFDKKVKEKAYIASARRCCVCKKFKGRNIEVHHIIQKADGGEDSFENAIPLCFDCHAEAGHYNPRHPKGARYSPTELRAHRDAWYKVVENGNVYAEEFHATHQYYLTNSFDIVAELVNGEFGNFPLDHIKLVKNELYHFLKSASEFQNNFNREENIEGQSFESLESYKSTYPDAIPIQSKWGIAGWSRSVTKEELDAKIAPRDFVTNYMLKHGVSPSEIAKVRFTEHGCCDSYYEEYILRRAKVVLLAFTNSTGHDLSCATISEHIFDNNDFISIEAVSEELAEFGLNNIPLMPGECLLIPISIVLTPFETDSYNPDQSLILEHVDSGQTQDTRPIDIEGFEQYPTVGPFHQVHSVNVLANNGQVSFDLRPLKMGSLFMISRYWECGCCPHIFVRFKGSDNWVYKGELFPNNPDVPQKYIVDTSSINYSGVESLKIVELENEVTYIQNIVIDGEVRVSNKKLHINDEIEIDIGSAMKVEIEGYYSLLEDVVYRNAQEIKLQKVFHTLADINRDSLTRSCNLTPQPVTFCANNRTKTASLLRS